MRVTPGIILLLFLISPQSFAVIKVKVTVKMVHDSAKAVSIGTVQSIDGATLTLNIDGMRGKGTPTAKVQFLRHQAIAKAVGKGAPVVLFAKERRGRRTDSLLHVADTWFVARPAADGWVVRERYVTGKTTFPGRTRTLVQLLRDMAGGKPGLLDGINRGFLNGKLQSLGKVPIQKPQWVIARDCNDDGKPDLLVADKGGVTLFVRTEKGYVKTTHLASVRSAYHAFSNGTLLIGKATWKWADTTFQQEITGLTAPSGRPLCAGFDGRKPFWLTTAGHLKTKKRTSQLWKAADPVSSATIGDYGADRSLHALAVRESGLTRYCLDGEGGPDDFERMTGVPLQRYYQRYKKGLKSPRILSLDVNGDKRRDALVVCETGGILLVGRGYGAFLVDYKAAPAIAPLNRGKATFYLKPNMVWAAADIDGDKCDDVIVVTAEGDVSYLPAKSR